MKFILCLLACISTAAAASAGVTASLDIGVLEQAKDVYFSYILNTLKHVTIPDISFKGGSIRDNSFSISEAVSDVQIIKDPAVNGVTLSMNSLSAHF
jgi:hypothetical protein